MPPRLLLTASSANPEAAAETEVVMPESDVEAPIKSAPISASPIPVSRARSRATPVILMPETATMTATATNANDTHANVQLPGSIS